MVGKCPLENSLMREHLLRDSSNVTRHCTVLKNNLIFNVNMWQLQTSPVHPGVSSKCQKRRVLYRECGEEPQLTQVTGGGTFLRYNQTSFPKHGAKHRYKRRIAFAETDRCRGSQPSSLTSRQTGQQRHGVVAPPILQRARYSKLSTPAQPFIVAAGHSGLDQQSSRRSQG
jgi:hypothetical protein